MSFLHDMRKKFQSTPLIRGETINIPAAAACIFQSTPLIRGETPAIIAQVDSIMISIHSPHTRGDG